MSPGVKSNYKELKKEAKTPIWTFIGLAIIAVLFIISLFSARNQEARTAKYILDPQIGDIYTVKTEDQNYTLYKVEYVEDEDVYMLLNLYEVSRASKVYKLKSKEYTTDTYLFTKSELKEMYDNKEITEIER